MTASIVERLKTELTPQLLGYLSKTAGEAPSATSKAAGTALTTLVSGLAVAAGTSSGLNAIARLVNDPVNDGTLLNQLPSLYQGTMTAAPIYRLGSQMLHQVFGSKLGTVNQSIATLAGVKPASAATMASTLAPHVLAVLGGELRARGDTTAAGLADLLGVEPTKAVAGAGDAVRTAAAAGAGLPTSATAAASVVSVTAGTAAVVPVRSAAGAEDDGADRAGAGATRVAAASARPKSGGGAWMIFPVGLAMGAGLLGVGSIISDIAGERQSGRTVVASSPTVAIPSPQAVQPVAEPPAAPAVAKPATSAEKSAAATPQGTTSYFGSTATLSLPGATRNPDYKPGAAKAPPPLPAQAKPSAPAAPEPLPELKPGPPGTTTLFGTGPSPVLGEAKLNPDYKPVPPSPPPAPVSAPIAVSESPLRTSPPGTTTYFGSTPSPADRPVYINPDYKPARPAAAEAPKPARSVPPPPAAAVATPPAPPVGGTTSFYGSSKTLALPPAAFNPDYKSAPKATANAPKAVALPTLDLAACRTAIGAAASEPVQFETARATLSAVSRPMLDRVAAAFKTCTQGKLKLEGHTDDRGRAGYNLRLSEARARSVADYLAGRGVARARLAAKGFGFAKPLVPNSSPENMARNRRIEFVVE